MPILSGLEIFLTVAAISWFTIGPWFFAITRLKNMGYDDARDIPRLFDDLGWQVAVPMVPFVFLGALADILFNWTVGSIVFREFPNVDRALIFRALSELTSHEIVSQTGFGYWPSPRIKPLLRQRAA